MRPLHRLCIVLIGIVLLLALTPSSALAVTPRPGNSVTIMAQQTVVDARYPVGGIVVTVSARPTPLMALDTATFVVTFSAVRPAAGPYTAILELQQRGGGPTRSATQGGFHLCRGQPLSVYWVWRAGKTLPPGVYTVRARLCDLLRRIVATATAPTPLVVAPH